MKTLTAIFFFSSFIFFGASCSDSDSNGNQNPGGTIEQTEITKKIAVYYSTPASSAQAVPAIQAVFNKKFPDATDIKWKVSNNVYEIDFEIGQTDYEAWYESNAILLMYKYDIPVSELPSVVSSAIAGDYPGYITDDVEKVYKGNIVGYYVELEKNRTDVHAFYNEDGTFISRTLWEDDSLKPANDADTETPAISGSLTDEEVDAYLTAYYSGYDEDVNPSNVPNAIRTNFDFVFSLANDIDWEVSSDIYKVDFEINNVDYDAWYKNDGTLLAYKFDVAKLSLPASVTAAISTRFSGYKIDDAQKVVKVSSMGYFVELENHNIEEDAYFSENGTYISNSFYKKGNGGSETEDPITPEIPNDGAYTDTEIDALLLAYEQSRDKDVRESDVPAIVLSAFNTLFTSTRDREWDYAASIYKVEFKIGHVDYEAWYTEDGALLMYTHEIKYTAVANTVQSAISAKYAGYKIDECEYFRKGTISGYLIELENSRTGADLIAMYKEDGTFISQWVD